MTGAPVAGTGRLPGAYRLKHRRLIRPLFDRNRKDVGSLTTGCIRLVYRLVPPQEITSQVPLQVGFAPGRGARTAVVRNRIKRILREVYRVHQHDLIDLFLLRDDVLTLMILFRGTPETASRCIPEDLPAALQRLIRQISKNAPGQHTPGAYNARP